MSGHAIPGTHSDTAFSKVRPWISLIWDCRCGAIGKVGVCPQGPFEKKKQVSKYGSPCAKRKMLPKSTDAVSGWYFNQCYLYESDIRKKTSRVSLLSSC